MRQHLAIPVIACCLALSIASSARGTHNFQAAKLVDMTTDDRLAGGTTHKSAIYVVQVGEIVYTLRGGRVSPNDKDYAKGLIVGDPVQVRVEGENVILLRPGGKDLKTSVVMREKQKAAQPVAKASSQQASAAQLSSSKPKLNNRDVIAMVSMGLPAEVVLAKIEASECAFDTTADGLSKLHDAKVPNEIVVAMIRDCIN